MTLDRTSVTVASRVMLPTYVVLFAGLGTNYAVTPMLSGRLAASPALAYANGLLPLPAWAMMFLTVAVLMAGALASGNRHLYRYALWLAILSMTIWAVVFALAVFRGEGSPTAFFWPSFVAVACYASNRSLLAGEV